MSSVSGFQYLPWLRGHLRVGLEAEWLLAISQVMARQSAIMYSGLYQQHQSPLCEYPVGGLVESLLVESPPGVAGGTYWRTSFSTLFFLSVLHSGPTFPSTKLLGVNYHVSEVMKIHDHGATFLKLGWVRVGTFISNIFNFCLGSCFF